MRSRIALLALTLCCATAAQQSAQSPQLPNGVLPIFETQEEGRPQLSAIGRDFEASFQNGFVFHARGKAAKQPFAWTFESAFLGDTRVASSADLRPEREAFRVTYNHGAVIERYDLRKEGIEQSFTIAKSPGGAGDLVIVGRVRSELQAKKTAARHGPLEFLDADGKHGVTYGAAIAFDARGKKTNVSTSWDGARVRLHVPSAWLGEATWPVTIDPLTSTKDVYRIPRGMPAGLFHNLAISREGKSKSRNVMIAFQHSNYFPIPKVPSLVSSAILCNDDFSAAVLVMSFIGRRLGRGSAPAPVEDAARWLVVLDDQVYFHDFGNVTVNSGLLVTYEIMPPPLALFTSGAVAGSLRGDFGLVVWRGFDGERTALFASTVDARQRSIASPRLVRAGVSFEPWLTPLRSGPNSSWVAAWYERDSRDKLSILACRLNEGSITAPATLATAGVPYNTSRIGIAGMDGKHLFVFKRSDKSLFARRLSWPDTSPAPSLSTFGTVLTSDGHVFGVAFDRNTKGHWGVTYGDSALSSPAARRVAVLAGLTVLETANAGHALTFDPSSGCYLLTVVGSDASGKIIQGRKLCPKGIVAQYGPSCGGFVDGPWPPLPGTGRYPVQLRKAAPLQPAVLVLGAAATRIDMTWFGMPGCFLLVDNAFASIAAMTDKAGSATAGIEIPLKVRGALYAQWLFVNPTAKGPIPVATTQGLRLTLR